MSRTRKILSIVGLSLLGLIIAVVIAGIIVVQTDWFRGFVKQKIVAAAEDATGGTVTIGSFEFDWKHLRAVVTDFVLHGTEPADAPPLLRVPRLEADIRLFTGIHHIVDVSYLGIDRPQANIVVLADGRTNLPQPKPSAPSNQPPLESIVNAAIGHFDLNNATIAFADAKEMLSLHANDFRVELYFNTLNQGYRGQIAFQPMYVSAGRNTPVAFNITLPLSIEKASVGLDGATIATARSNIRISGSVENLRNPKISARVLGQLALEDVKDLGNLPVTLRPGAPSAVDLDANATISSDSIQVSQLQLKLGASHVDASGTLKNPQGQGSLQFDTQLALAEIGQLMNLEQKPAGTVALKGTAKLDAAGNYDVDGDLTAKNVSIEESGRRIGNVDLVSGVHVDPHDIGLNKLRLDALGGTLAGDASLQDFARYQLHGDLSHFTLHSVAAILGETNLPYSGTIEGPISASGDLKAPNSLSAQVALAIAPGKTGMPVSGRLNASYDTASNDLKVDNSYVALPHSRLAISGSALRQLNVALTTTDLKDFSPVAGNGAASTVNLQGHQAEFTGTVTGGIAAPHVAGRLRASGFSVQGRMFDSLALDASASQSGAAVQQGSVAHGSMRIDFSGQVGMNRWKIAPQNPIGLQSTIQNSDLADIMALIGEPAADTSGAFEAHVQINGTVGDPTGSASLTATNGAIQGQPFNRIQAQVNLSDQLITIPSATADSGSAHLALAAEFHHSRDSLTTGQLHARVEGNGVDLAQVQALQHLRPGAGGTLDLNADVTANLGSPQIQLVSATANVNARGLAFDKQNFGDATLTASSARQDVQYQLVSNFGGSNIRVTGNTNLQQDYRTSLDASVSNLSIERVLAAAQKTDIPAKGTLSLTAHVSGTKDEPTGDIDLNLANAVLYQEPVSRLQMKASYETQRAVLQQLEIAAAGTQLAMTAEFDHPKGDLTSGQLRFHLNNSRVDLARVQTIQASRPGLGGIIQLGADGTAELRASAPRVLVQTLNANLSANALSAEGKNLGDATLTAATQNNNVNFTLTSNLAGATIRGSGRAQPSGDYPVDAQITFNNVNWAGLQPLLGSQDAGTAGFNAGTDGEVTIRGPVLTAEQLSGSVRLSRVELSAALPSKAIQGSAPPAQVVIKNTDPVSVTLDRGNVRIESAHFTGPQTDIQATGSLSLKDRSMNLSLNANADLAVLQTLDRDFSSSGNVTLNASVRGTMAKPSVNGQLQLQNASVNYTQFPNGLSNANGTVQFNGNTALIRNLTGESGGGKVTLAGFLLLSQAPQFGLRASATNVRIDVQQGVSVVITTNLNLAGTTAASTLSGSAVINRVNYAPKTDLGSMLSRAAPPVQGSSAPSMLDNVKLDLQVTTSDALAVQSSLAQGLEGTANLHVQGTASLPSVLGRVSLTSGSLTFFGNSYTVNSGTISFYNPIRIDPILDASLETNTEGVDVTLHVTGPIDNLNLSYTSDPPLQFEEIIALLATGKTPTTDPTLLANNPPAQQGVTQMGESAVMSQAIANPVANSLARVFGVSQLKINPEFTNGSSTPQTTLTLQQQVAKNITFTYITQVDNANAETIRAEITFDPRWSAAAMRDENGIFSINVYYKRRFR